MIVLRNELLWSVCGKTFSRRFIASWIVALGVVAAVLPAVAQAPDADRWAQLRTANDLDSEGNTPFHLKMAFQLYDLEGKPSETGTAEEWWYSPHSIRTVISSPSLNEDGSAKDHNEPSSARENYLVNELLAMAVRPVPKYDPADEDALQEQKREIGKVSLECIDAKADTKRAKPKTIPAAGSVRFGPLPTLCMQPNSDKVLLIFLTAGSELVTRNSTGKFRDTYAALELRISYLGLYAITGKVTTLQAIDPAKGEPEQPASPAAVSESAATAKIGMHGGAMRIPAGVIAARRIKLVPPEYPEMAMEQHMSGSVLLDATVGGDGSVKNLVPIASSGLMFTRSAIEAVSKWKYSPYLLNGEPTEVDTTITLNFAISPFSTLLLMEQR